MPIPFFILTSNISYLLKSLTCFSIYVFKGKTYMMMDFHELVSSDAQGQIQASLELITWFTVQVRIKASCLSSRVEFIVNIGIARVYVFKFALES